MEHRQKNWPKWLASAEFVVNNKIHIVTKVSPFIANYRRELRMGGDIRKKRKIESAMEFVERMKKVHKEAVAALKNLVFKERPARKLMERYIGPYTIEKVVSLNAIKLQLPSLMRIHLVINVSWIV